jgi:cation diffusion facilitator CzcD-associated flavoprotein CzcO
MTFRTGAAELPDHEVLVIGAGFSGIGMAIGLRRIGLDDFIVVDERDDVGGTWHANRYPGIAVDVPGFSYSFGFAPITGISCVFPPGSELKAYADDCVRRYEIHHRLRLGSKVVQATYDESAHLWRALLDNGTVLKARFLVCATGWLTKAKRPQIAGLCRFKGDIIHTAEWNPSLALAGRRLCVIGTGASAVQLVPTIASCAARLTVYQRTPVWLLPKPNFKVPRFVRALFRLAPWTYRAIRVLTDSLLELSLIGLIYNRQFPFLVKAVEAMSRLYLRNQVKGDPELIRKLTPAYGLGCKRPSADAGFWRAFTRDNVELVTEPIEEITETGVRSADGRERACDVLVLATGFHVLDNLPPLRIYGKGGRELRKFWQTERFQAYEGSSVKGFPNLWFIVGPYSFTGGTWFKTIDYQVKHALRVIGEARRRGATEAVIRPEKHDASFRRTLRRQRNTVFFNNDCSGSNSYYFDERGDAPAVRPATTFEAAWRANHFDVDDYHYDAAEARNAPLAVSKRTGA